MIGCRSTGIASRWNGGGAGSQVSSKLKVSAPSAKDYPFFLNCNL
jgi:hypothetical protein